jgi:hypothetical protein
MKVDLHIQYEIHDLYGFTRRFTVAPFSNTSNEKKHISIRNKLV